jgi:hypothetical protein
VVEAAPARVSKRKDVAAAAGGVAVVGALLALGAAGLARSAGGMAQCADVVRATFPHFRVIPCRQLLGSGGGSAPSGAPVLGGSGSAAPPPTARGARRPPAASVQVTLPATSAPSPVAPYVPRIARVAGAAIVRHGGLRLLGIVLLSMLGAANAVLVGIRARVGRVQVP